MTYWLVYGLLLGGGLAGGIGLLVYLHRRDKAAWIENLVLLGLALFLTLMGLELYFKLFFAQPDAFATLAEQNWQKRYVVGQRNSWGFRDVEWTDEMVAGKIKVMVVGDSFVEGAGIERPEDRFPERLGQKLGPQYVVMNLGKRRANTAEEIEAVINYPYSPDILVWSYFVNDIERVRWWYEVETPPSPSSTVAPWLRPLVQNSYVVNFIYWRLARLGGGNRPDVKWQSLLELYKDPGAWWLHREDLLSIPQGAQAQQIPLIVVVFPSMNRPQESRVIALFEEAGVPVIDVNELIEGQPTRRLVASPVDPHPNEWVHEQVAEALYVKFVELELVP